jgi:hypothetical protein
LSQISTKRPSSSSRGREREPNSASQRPNHNSGERRSPRGPGQSRVLHDLDRQLRSERGPNGEPSTSDFQSFELLEIVEKFANDFDELPALIPGRDDYRVLISTGVVVRAYTVIGQASADGSVGLVSLDLDTSQDWT